MRSAVFVNIDAFTPQAKLFPAPLRIGRTRMDMRHSRLGGYGVFPRFPHVSGVSPMISGYVASGWGPFRFKCKWKSFFRAQVLNPIGGVRATPLVAAAPGKIAELLLKNRSAACSKPRVQRRATGPASGRAGRRLSVTVMTGRGRWGQDR